MTYLMAMLVSANATVIAESTEPVKHGNRVTGHVIDKTTEENLPHATILIVETKQGAVSDNDGLFAFDKLPAGSYTLRVQLLGYETQEKVVTVSNNFTTDCISPWRLRH